MSAPGLARHFEQLAGAPGGVAQLRELILALAVRGKLVPQQDAVGYASRLLEESRAQVRAKMQEGKAKKEKPAADVDAAETPFEIPDTWQWCRLTDTGEFINGLAFKPTDWAPDGLPIIRIQNLSGRNQEFNRTRGSFHPSVIVRSGDILVSWSATLDAFIWQGETGVLNQHIFRVEPAPCVDRGFLYWLLKWAIRDLAESEHAHGLVMSHINRGPFLAKPIALPPLAEQARIVARVDELMQLCDALEAKGRLEAQQHARLLETLLGTLTESTTPEELAANWQRVAEHFDLLLDRPEAVDALEQTVLQLATSGRFSSRVPHVQTASVELADQGSAALPFSVPADWSWVSLGQLTSLVTSGSRSWKDYYSDEGATFIRSQDIKYDRLEFDNRAYVRIPPSAEGVRTQVRPRDVLITITGANVGKAAVVEEPLSEAYVSQHVALVRLLDPRIADYLHLWLVNEHGGRLRLLGSSYGAKPGLNLQNIKDLPVPLPPLEEQVRIVARVAELRRLCADLRQRLASSQATQSRLAGALVESVASA